MAETTIYVHIDDREVVKLLKQLEATGKDMTPVMRTIAGIMADAVEQNFEKEGRPDHWQPLALSTIKQREKHGHWPGQMLQRTGSLASSVTIKFDANSASVGTNKVYAAIHQFGGLAGRNQSARIPAHPFLVLDNDDINEIIEAIEAALKVD